MSMEAEASPSSVPRPLRVLVLHPWSLGEAPEAWNALTILIRSLTDGGAEVHLLLPDYREPLTFENLRITYFFPPDPVRNIGAIAEGLSRQEGYAGFTREEMILLLRYQVYRDQPPFEAMLDGAIAGADAVVLDFPFWAKAVGPLCKKHGKPLLLTHHERAKAQPKAQKLLLVSEVEGCRLADAVFFTSAADRETFARYGVAGEISAPAAYGAVLARLTGKPLGRERKRGLVLIDPTLKIIHGHFFNYAKSISDAAAWVGVPFLALGSLGVAEEISSQLDVVPTFQRSYLDDLFRHPEAGTPGEGHAQYDFAMANAEFYNDMAKALPRVGVSDVLLMPTLNHRQLLAWSWFLNRWPSGLCPEVVLFLRFTYYQSTGDGGLGLHSNVLFLSQTLAALQQAAPGRCLRLVTDSDGLAKEYRQWTSLPIEVLPIPHTATGKAGEGDAGVPPKKEGRLRFIIMGDAREEKGVPLVALALAQLAQRPDFGTMEFVLQAFIGSRHHVAMEPFLDAFRQLEQAGENVTLIDRALDEAAYHAFLTSADVVLIPYQKTAYFSRTSGIFTEAVANGKPVVVTEGTWMSGQLGDSGAGVLCADGSAESLAEAILKVRDSYPVLRENVLKLREGYLAYHNPDSFLKEVMHPGGRAA